MSCRIARSPASRRELSMHARPKLIDLVLRASSGSIRNLQVNPVTKDELRAELERQAQRYKDVYGGEVITYAAQPDPDRKPWRKKPSLLDQAFDKEIEKIEKERQDKQDAADEAAG